MANVKISQLPSLSTMTDLAQIPVVAGGTTYQITGSNLSAYFSASAAGSKIVNGTTEANIGTAGGNANISVGGVSNVALFTTTGLTVSGVLAVPVLTTNNIRSDDSSFVNIEDGVNVTGAVVASGNIIGAAANIPSIVSVSLDVENISARGAAGVNIGAGGFNNLVVEQTQVLIQNVPLSVAGNITGGNLVTAAAVSAASVSASGNVTGGNLNAAGLSLSSNVVSALSLSSSLTAATTISAVGNITGGNLITAAAVSAASVSASGNVTGGNINTNTLVGTSTTVKSTGALNLSATGNIVVNSTYINNLSDPVQNQDAATKYYVDTVAQGLNIHQAANLASTQDLATYTGATVTYDNGTSGVGATLSLVGNTLTTLDGTAIPAGASTRLLIKNQANAVLNGVYNYTSSSLLTRTTDTDTPAGLAGGDFLFVTSGSTQADTGWIQTTDNVVVGTSNVVFSQFSSAGAYTANTSAGLALNGSVFSAKVDNTTTAFDGSGNIIVKASANLTTPNIGAATGSSLSVTGNITGDNLNAAGLSLSSNVVSALISAANITTTANISGGNILGNGYQLTRVRPHVTSTDSGGALNIMLASGFNGPSNAVVGTGTSGGPATINPGTGQLVVAGATVGGYGLAVNGGGSPLTGTVSATGNITGANFITTGLISATGNITGGNILGGANVNATTHTGTTVSVTGNITGGNIVTAAAVSAASVSATANISGGNVTTAGLTSTASLSITGNTATVTSANYSIGYLTIPQVTLSANATAGLTDSGKHLYSTTAGNLELTIPDNANVAFPVGTAISIVVQAAGNVLVVTQPSTTLYLGGNATSGNRVVGTYGMATIMKVATNTWFISGTGVS